MIIFLKKLVNSFFGLFGIAIVKSRVDVDPFLFLKKYNINTVLDVGANIGQFAGEIRKVLPDVFIHSFEPMKECFEKLNINYKTDNKFKAYNFALGDKIGNSIIKKNNYAPSSSIMENSDINNEAFPFTKSFSEEEIVIKTLDSIYSDLNIKGNILLKIDVQGFEDKVLNGAVNFLNKVDVLIIENSFFELYKGQILFEQMYEFLHNRGFVYFGGVQIKRHPKTGEILFEDSVFIHKK